MKGRRTTALKMIEAAILAVECREAVAKFPDAREGLLRAARWNSERIAVLSTEICRAVPLAGRAVAGVTSRKA